LTIPMTLSGLQCRTPNEAF